MSLALPGAAAMAGFLVLAYFARASGPLPGDVGVERVVQSIPWGPLSTVFGWVTAFNGFTQTMAGLVILFIVVVVNPRTFAFAALASLSGLMYAVSNSFIDRPRPSSDLVQVTEHLGAHSFPSGHAVFVVTYVSLIVLCVAGNHLNRRGLIAAAAVGVAVVLLTSAARLATGGHWPTDVYGGWLLGGGWILLLLSFRPVSSPVLSWFGDPAGAWRAHHPGLPNTFDSRRRLWAHAAYTPVVQSFERLGFAVRGVLWMVMGVLLVASAFGFGRQVDLYGSVRFLLENPWRGAIAVVVVLAIGGYAVWGYVRTFLDPLRRGRSLGGLVARMGFLSSALSYTLVVAFTLILGFTSASASDSAPVDTASAFVLLEGYGAVYLLAAIVVAIGISQAIDGWREPFTRDVLIEDAPHGALFHAWTWLGRIGFWARAVVFVLLGFLIVTESAAGSSWSTSFTHAFEWMNRLPGGWAVVSTLGIGLIALGLHSFGSARWMRLRPPVIPEANQ
jgi:membrane-associated phospholipid phosphatase